MCSFARLQCQTCGEETLHHLNVCVHCKGWHEAWRPTWVKLTRKLRNQQDARAKLSRRRGVKKSVALRQLQAV